MTTIDPLSNAETPAPAPERNDFRMRQSWLRELEQAQWAALGEHSDRSSPSSAVETRAGPVAVRPLPDAQASITNAGLGAHAGIRAIGPAAAAALASIAGIRDLEDVPDAGRLAAALSGATAFADDIDPVGHHATVATAFFGSREMGREDASDSAGSGSNPEAPLAVSAQVAPLPINAVPASPGESAGSPALAPATASAAGPAGPAERSPVSPGVAASQGAAAVPSGAETRVSPPDGMGQKSEVRATATAVPAAALPIVAAATPALAQAQAAVARPSTARTVSASPLHGPPSPPSHADAAAAATRRISQATGTATSAMEINKRATASGAGESEVEAAGPNPREARAASREGDPITARSLRLFKGEGETDVVIRDAALEAEALPALVARMGAQLAAAGTRMGTFTVNGKTVYEPAATDSAADILPPISEPNPEPTEAPRGH